MDHDADEHLSRRMEALYHHRKWILGGIILASLTALVVSLFLPNIYRATTYVLVSESKIEASSQNAMWQYSLIRTYVPFVDSDALIGRAIRDLHLDQSPYGLTVDSFRRHRYLDVDVPKGTRLLEIDVEFPDARLAADLANYLAQNAAGFNNELTMRETQSTQAFLKQRLDQSAKHLAEIEAERLTIKKNATLEEREKQISILLDEKAQVDGQVEQYRIARAQKEAQVKALAEQLAKQPQILSLKKSVTSDPFVQHVVEKGGGNADGQLAVTEESLSTVHEHLQQQYAEALASARSNEAAAQTGESDLAAINAKIGRLLQESIVRKSEVERVDRQYQIAKEDFETADRSYQNASVAVTAQSQDLKQLAPATPPQRPVSPNVVLNVVLATFLSGALLSLAALTWESLRAMRWRRANSMEHEEELFVARQ